MNGDIHPNSTSMETHTQQIHEPFSIHHPIFLFQIVTFKYY